MAQEIINVGSAPNDGQGDPIREAFTKCNNNFTELFSGSIGSNAISNGNSVVQISTANGNISMSVSGTANVAVVTTTGITVSNTLTAANIDAVNLVINNISSDDSTFITIEDGVIVNGVISAVDSITGGNILTAGNVTGAFFIGDGSQLTNLPAGNYSNANVAAYLPTYSGNITANVISAAGNIAGTNITAVGVLTASGVLVDSGNIGVPVGVTTANVFNGRVTTINFGGVASNIFIANVNSTTQVAGNLTAGGQISATGNITGNFILGNGSQLTGIVSGGPAFMAYVTTGQNLSTTGAITQLSLIFDTVEREDPANLYNESTGIFQPDVPGYYQINAGTAIGTTNPSPTLTDVYYSLVVHKNTSPVVSGSIQSPVSFGGTYFLPESNASTLIYLNGTTDYVQCVLVYFVGTSVWTTTTNAIPNYFQAVWTHE
jgi:hypothetical protein